MLTSDVLRCISFSNAVCRVKIVSAGGIEAIIRAMSIHNDGGLVYFGLLSDLAATDEGVSQFLASILFYFRRLCLSFFFFFGIFGLLFSFFPPHTRFTTIDILNIYIYDVEIEFI